MKDETCPDCGYEGEPDDDGVCPECGAEMEPDEAIAPDSEFDAMLAAAGDDNEDDEALTCNTVSVEDATDAEKQAQKGRASKYGIEVRKDGNVTKPKEFASVEDSKWADPVNYAYPMHDKEHCQAAVRYWGKPANKAKYSTKSQGIITKRMKKLAKAMGVTMMGNDDWQELDVELEGVADYAAAEALLLEAQCKPDHEAHVDFIDKAQAKVHALMADGREAMVDSFIGSIEILEHGAEKTTFRAIVAQTDKCNKNKRLYPRKEIVKNLERVNALAAAGGFVGLDGHPGFLGGGDTARDVAVKYTKLMLKKDDLYAEGEIVPTFAGREVAACWKAGVGLEWSLRGYGGLEDVTDDDGNILHCIVKNYVLDGVDIVLRGAAETQTLQVNYDNLGAKPEGATMSETKPDVVEDVQTETAPPPPAAPIFDAAAITADIVSQATVAVTAAATQATNVALAAARLADYKASKLSGIEDTMRKPIERALTAATTIEAVDEVMAEYAPLLSEVFEAKKYAGIGLVTGQNTVKEKTQKWYLGGEFVDRPKTAYEAKAQLLESIPSNGRHKWSDPHKVWSHMLDMLEQAHPEYFGAVTQRAMLEAPTDTTALSPILPQVLPMLRQLFPQLIPFEISSVQPLAGPTGRAYFLNFITSAAVDLSDSSTFDSDWADHTEGATKSQISLDLDYTDLTTVEKAIYYEITSALAQDLSALHSLDAEAELIDAASAEIAREINAEFLETLRVGAGAGNQNYGTAVPTGATYSAQEWYNLLMAFLAKANGLVNEKVYNDPDWIVAGPGASPLIESLQSFNANPTGGVRKFGKGLTLIGTLSQWNVYKAAWFSRNVMLLGYKPPSWQETGAVYAPYIPLYLSPSHYDASKNLASRSVASRYAMKVLRANAFTTITVQPGTAGTNPWD